MYKRRATYTNRYLHNLSGYNVISYMLPGHTIIDAGCSTGVAFENLMENYGYKFERTIGIDLGSINDGVFTDARPFTDICDIDDLDGQADIIILVDVTRPPLMRWWFSGCSPTERAYILQKVHDWLKPDGILITNDRRLYASSLNKYDIIQKIQMINT